MQEQFTFRRRRRAIDPSLGYYIYECEKKRTGEPQDEHLVSSVAPVDDTLFQPSEVGATSQGPPDIMAEGFLRIHIPNRKRPSRKSRPGNTPPSCKAQSTDGEGPRLGDPLELRFDKVRGPVSSCQRSVSDVSEAPFDDKAVGVHRGNVAPGKSEYEAATPFRTDPVAVVARRIRAPASRRPLSFQPVPHPPQIRRQQTNALEDSKRGNPFQSPAFCHSRRPKKQKLPRKKRDDRPLVCPPLEFVEFSRAENAYQVLFPSPVARQLTPKSRPKESPKMVEETTHRAHSLCLGRSDGNGTLTKGRTEETENSDECVRPDASKMLQPLPSLFSAFMSNLANQSGPNLLSTGDMRRRPPGRRTGQVHYGADDNPRRVSEGSAAVLNLAPTLARDSPGTSALGSQLEFESRGVPQDCPGSDRIAVIIPSDVLELLSSGARGDPDYTNYDDTSLDGSRLDYFSGLV